MGVRLLPIKEEEVVLVRHSYEALWYLPGGGVKKGETLERAVRREAKEELGAELESLQLFGIYSNFYEYKSDHIAVFLAQSFSLSGAGDREIESIKAFPLDALPDDISPGSRRRIQEYTQGKLSNFGTW